MNLFLPTKNWTFLGHHWGCWHPPRRGWGRRDQGELFYCQIIVTYCFLFSQHPKSWMLKTEFLFCRCRPFAKYQLVESIQSSQVKRRYFSTFLPQASFSSNAVHYSHSVSYPFQNNVLLRFYHPNTNLSFFIVVHLRPNVQF